jgi:hypothetical protein
MTPGFSKDTTLNRIRQQTGRKDLKKSDVTADPALSRMAEQMIKGTGGGGGDVSGVQVGQTATGPNGQKKVYRGGGVWTDLTTPPEEE